MSKNKKTILLNGSLGRMGEAIIDEIDKNYPKNYSNKFLNKWQAWM